MPNIHVEVYIQYKWKMTHSARRAFRKPNTLPLITDSKVVGLN